MTVRERLARLLGLVLRLRPAEVPTVLILFGWCFNVVGAIWLSRTVRDSLFLAHVSAAELPKMYIVSPLTITLVGAAYARVADRIRRDRLVIGSALAVAVALAAARFALGPTRPMYYVLYVGVDVVASIAAMQFWTVAGEQFTARDAKRLIGLIAAGGTAANIVIGFGVSGVVKRAGAENLLLVCAALYLVAAGLAAALTAATGGRLGARPRPRVTGARDPRGLDAPGAGHLRMVAVVVAAAVVTLTLVDFQFKSIAAAAMGGDRVALVRYFGVLAGVTGCVALAIQLGVTARLLARAGVTGVLLILPVYLGLGAVGLLLVPGLVAATVCKAGDFTLRYTVYDAGMQLLYLPVPARVRSRMKATIDAVIRPGTEALVGVGLLICRAAAVPRGALAAAALVTAGVWTAAVRRLGPAYVRSLRETLRRRRLDFEALPHSADLDAALALEGLAPAGGGEKIPPEQLLAALGTGRRSVEAVAVSGVGLEPDLAAVLDDAAATSGRRRDAARALGRLATPEAAAELARHLEVAGDGLRGEVCRALAAAHRRNPALPIARAAVERAIDLELSAAYTALAAAEGLGRPETAMKPDGTRAAPPFATEEADGAAALISKALRERSERATGRIFHLLEVLHRDARLAEVARSLGDPEPARRANAVEVLDSVLQARLRKRLVPLVDDTPRFMKLAAVASLVDVPRRGREAWVRELLGDGSAWMTACAVYYAGMNELVALGGEVTRLREHPSPIVRETAAQAAERLAAP